jgi:hypothetical protein
MPRQNLNQAPASLRKIAESMRSAASRLESLAVEMERHQINELSLAHQVTVENGILGARRMAREGINKLEAVLGFSVLEEKAAIEPSKQFKN